MRKLRQNALETFWSGWVGCLVGHVWLQRPNPWLWWVPRFLPRGWATQTRISWLLAQLSSVHRLYEPSNQQRVPLSCSVLALSFKEGSNQGLRFFLWWRLIWRQCTMDLPEGHGDAHLWSSETAKAPGEMTVLLTGETPKNLETTAICPFCGETNKKCYWPQGWGHSALLNSKISIKNNTLWAGTVPGVSQIPPYFSFTVGPECRCFAIPIHT